jgi:hypothetical protein
MSTEMQQALEVIFNALQQAFNSLSKDEQVNLIKGLNDEKISS